MDLKTSTDGLCNDVRFVVGLAVFNTVLMTAQTLSDRSGQCAARAGTPISNQADLQPDEV